MSTDATNQPEFKTVTNTPPKWPLAFTFTAPFDPALHPEPSKPRTLVEIERLRIENVDLRAEVARLKQKTVVSTPRR